MCALLLTWAGMQRCSVHLVFNYGSLPAQTVLLLCRHQVASQDVPSPYEGAFPENIKK